MESNLSLSQRMDITKVFAILTVIIAHSRNVDYPFLSQITERIGALGVIVFLFIAGYYFNPDKYGIKKFFKSKITSILIPWIFTGTIIFLVVKPFILIDWLNWLVGNGSYLYYLVVLMICYFLLCFVRGNKGRIFLITVNVISLILTSLGILDALAKDVLGVDSINNYLNVFNWIGFFTLGIMAKGRLEQFLLFNYNKRWIVLILFISVIGLGLIIEPTYSGYFSKLGMLSELLGGLCLFNLSKFPIFNHKTVFVISGLTFAIYLIHFLVFPFRRFLPQNQVFEFVNPIVYLLLASGLILGGEYIATQLKLDRMYRVLLGIRKSKSN